MGAPESATRETMLEFKSLMDNYARAQGGIGIFTNQLYWPGYYIGGNIFFRVGRFEYWIRRYDNKNVVVVYKNKRSGQTVALLNTREPHTKDGFRDSPAVRSIKEDYWVPSPIENDGSFVSGTPVSPDGRALRKTVRLPLSEWSCVMDKDSVMLDMHIPAGGGMSLDICVDSFRRARDFFRAQFPALNPVAVNCHSWIFSPNLPEFMPENSNLVQLMRECYLYPTESGKRDGLWFFFYQKNFDLATAPRKTSLQRTVAEHLERGGDLRSGGMFFLLDDLDNFGQQYYARNFPSGF
jgi:hypothetical protein